MPLGIPCRRSISVTYNYANLFMPQVSCIGRKSADLVRLSTTTQLAFFLEAEMGNPMMKSIEIESHFQVGIASGLNPPMGHWCSALTFGQVKHLSAYPVISLFILSHQMYCFKSRYIFVPPGCIKYRVLWAFVSIFSFNSALLGTHKRFWNLNILSASTTKPGACLSLNFT